MKKMNDDSVKTKKPKKAPKKRGAKCKLDEKMKTRLEFLYRNKGFTDAEACLVVNIDMSTLTKWKQRFPEFFKDLKDWKYEYDHRIVRSLSERAEGYKCPETKAQWVTDEVEDPDTGEWHKVGRWETIELTKYYPPDFLSMAYWLNNRMREEWKQRQDMNINFSEPLIDIVRKLREEKNAK